MILTHFKKKLGHRLIIAKRQISEDKSSLEVCLFYGLKWNANKKV
ncbi:hypothetical protein HMPREF1232_0374 [Streptococcus pyogenes GA40468]|nr:hypothetical protein HMPREF1232_0374 [Streptococcus pyogenes GA40468]